MLSWFAFFHDGPAPLPPLGPDDLAVVEKLVRSVPGLHQGLVMTPTPEAVHPFAGQAPAPALVLQLHYRTIEALEAAIALDGPLSTLPRQVPGRMLTQQAMLTRRYPVPDATPSVPAAGQPCSFLVHYPGPASDLNAWNRHYTTHHPPLMARFPGVRLVEIYTGIDWVCGQPWPAETAMQRNKLMFDSPAALSAALASPVLAEMRADFNSFPPFKGGNVHHAFDTRIIG